MSIKRMIMRREGLVWAKRKDSRQRAGKKQARWEKSYTYGFLYYYGRGWVTGVKNRSNGSLTFTFCDTR